MGAARDFLKKITASGHLQLDQTPLISGLAEGRLAVPAYRRMLAGYLEFFGPWEAAMLRDYPETVARLGESRFSKSLWLKEDIATLGGFQGVAGGLPPLLPPAHPAALAGCLYVVEGSTLGGMHLSRDPDGLPGGAAVFFTGYGSGTVQAWREFIEWLEGELPDEASREAAAAAALEVFGWFQRTFERIGTDPA